MTHQYIRPLSKSLASHSNGLPWHNGSLRRSGSFLLADTIGRYQKCQAESSAVCEMCKVGTESDDDHHCAVWGQVEGKECKAHGKEEGVAASEQTRFTKGTKHKAPIRCCFFLATTCNTERGTISVDAGTLILFDRASHTHSPFHLQGIACNSIECLHWSPRPPFLPSGGLQLSGPPRQPRESPVHENSETVRIAIYAISATRGTPS